MKISIVFNYLLVSVAALPSPVKQETDAMTAALEPLMMKESIKFAPEGFGDMKPPGTLPAVSQTLQAKIDYHCPHSGPDSFLIRWRAIYSFKTGELEIDNLLGLEPVKKIEVSISANNFAATLRHSHCHADASKKCTYRFSAQTLGTVHHNPISMELELVEEAMHESDQPKLTEYCEFRRHVVPGAANCSVGPTVIERNAAKCVIDKFTVSSLSDA